MQVVPMPQVADGSSLWFQVDDRAEFDNTSERARAAASDHLLAEPAWKPLAHYHEFSLRDLDGYVLAVHTPHAHESNH